MDLVFDIARPILFADRIDLICPKLHTPNHFQLDEVGQGQGAASDVDVPLRLLADNHLQNDPSWGSPRRPWEHGVWIRTL